MVHQPINSLAVGDAVNGIYLLRCAKVQHSKNGSEYLLATLADKSGSISCIVWNYDGSLDSELGAPVLVTGTVKEYQGKTQISVRSAEPAPENEVILSAILPTAPVSSEILYHRVRTAIATIDDEDYRLICETIYDENKKLLLTAPASILYHHAYIGGLLTHVSDMVSSANYWAAQYKAIDRSLLLAAVLLHDIGKLRGYEFSRYGYALGHTNEGSLLGHPALGSKMVSDTAVILGISPDKILPLQNAIIHHHSNGDRTQLRCFEARLLQLLDYADCCASSAGEGAA